MPRYPTDWRYAARHGIPARGGGLSQPLRLLIINDLPVPDMPPLPKSAGIKPLARALPFIGRSFVRGIPYVGWAWTAYELYKWWNSAYPSWSPGGYAQCGSLDAGCGELAARYYAWGPACITRCFDFTAPCQGFNYTDPDDNTGYMIEWTMQFHSPGLGWYGHTKAGWYDPAPGTNTDLPGFRHDIPQWGPAVNPGWYPNDLPVMQPARQPAPNAVHPNAAPNVNPDTQPSNETPPRRLRYDVPPLPYPFVPAPTSIRPYPDGPVIEVQPPTAVVDVHPETNRARTTHQRGRPRRRKPDRKVKERKINVRSVAGSLWGIINLVTEAQDFVEAMWKSIAADKRSKPHKNKRTGVWYPVGTDQKLIDLWRNWDEIDVADAVVNYVNNQAEDAFYGTIGMGEGRASRNIGLSTGLGRATQSGSNLPEIEDQDRTGLLPTLAFDHETGEFSVTWEMFDYESIGVDLGATQRIGEVGKELQRIWERNKALDKSRW